MTVNFMRPKNRNEGFTVVEVLIGLLIGTLLIYAIYFVFSLNERTSRLTASISETQMSGLSAMYLMEHLVSDAGSSFMNDPKPDEVAAHDTTASELLKCHNPSGGGTHGLEGVFIVPNGSTSDLTMRALPAVIQSNSVGGAPRDELYVFMGTSTVYNEALKGDAIPSHLSVSASNTFKLPIPFSADDILVAVNGSNQCATFRVNSDPIATPSSFEAQLTGAKNLDNVNTVVNLGKAAHFRFFVNANHDLQMDQYVFNGAAWQLLAAMTLATNVQVFALQYGIDSTLAPGNSVIDTWISADDANWSANVMRDANVEKVRQIKAIRVGLIVRTGEPEKVETVTPEATMTLFAADGPSVSFTPPPPQNNLKYRYRKYETTIPLRNISWN